VAGDRKRRRGLVARTRLETRLTGDRNTIQAIFREELTLGILVPAEMQERRTAGDETMEGRATYTHYRRFQVNTAFEIK
jgi:hypothetical protein